MPYSIDGRHTENYHGFNIESWREDPTMGDYQRWHFRISQGNMPIFRYSTRISRTYAVILGGEDRADRELYEVGKRRVHGKINLGYYVEGENEEFYITDDSSEPSHLDKMEIRLHILQVLQKIRELNPTRHKLADFDVNGFCEVLGISYGDYLSNAAYLRDKGYAADSILQQNILENGGIYITSDGIDYLEKQQQQNLEATMSKEAEEIRDKILVALYDHEERGNGNYLDSKVIAKELGLSERTVRYHLDILHRDHYIDTAVGFTDYSAILNASGKQRVMEGYRHSSRANFAGGTSINITHSTVGMLNTGQIENVKAISVNISQLASDGYSEMAQALQQLTDFVIQNQEIAHEQREEMIDLLADLSEQANLKPEQRRRPSLLRATVNGIITGLTVGGSVAEIWNTCGPIIVGYLGIA